jgi:hypothetical protein
MRMGGFSEDDGDLETVAWGVGWPPDVCWRNHRPNVVRKTFNLEHLSHFRHPKKAKIDIFLNFFMIT